MMEHAFAFSIRNEERVKTSVQFLLSPYQVHSTFPKKPLFNNAFLKKLDIDTLFFMFYHQQGTYQQYLAAKELKSKGWLFHKRFQSWFLRQGDPKLSAADREKGSFMYFDYETTWSMKRKNDFEFDYSYLEND
jgi:CCR4-NOT transcription complex subunit 3